MIEDGDMEDWLKVTADHLVANILDLHYLSVFHMYLCVSVHITLLQVCNSCGQVGYVPERYVQFLCLPAEDTVQLDSSFSSTSSAGNKERAGSRG